MLIFFTHVFVWSRYVYSYLLVRSYHSHIYMWVWIGSHNYWQNIIWSYWIYIYTQRIRPTGHIDVSLALYEYDTDEDTMSIRPWLYFTSNHQYHMRLLTNRHAIMCIHSRLLCVSLSLCDWWCVIHLLHYYTPPSFANSHPHSPCGSIHTRYSPNRERERSHAWERDR